MVEDGITAGSRVVAAYGHSSALLYGLAASMAIEGSRIVYQAIAFGGTAYGGALRLAASAYLIAKAKQVSARLRKPKPVADLESRAS